MMRQALSLLCLLVTLVTAAAATAQAQDTRWIQIEAQPSQADAEERARAWQGLFRDVAGFSTGSGWFIITLGPYTTAEAEARRAELRAENLIPRDSFVSDGATYGPMFWPVGATLPTLPQADLPAPDAPMADTATVPADPAPPAALPALADETPEQARASEAALSQADREALQRGLMWFGFYDARVDGAFGRGTRASMAAWQSANGAEPTGILTTLQRAALLTAYGAEEAAYGFATVTEAEAGIEITLPLSLVAFDHYEPPFVHFTAKGGGDTRILLLSQPGDEAALAGLYATLQTLQIMPANGPRSLKGNSFTLRGESADLVTEAFATTDRGMVKGWLVSWNPRTAPASAADMATAPDMDRVLGQIRASFRPIGDRALDPGLVPLSPGVKSGLLAGLQVKTPRLSRSGFYVDAAGTVLTTTEAVDQCARITLGNGTEATVTATDPAGRLAIVQPAARLAPVAFAHFADGNPGTEIAVSGYAYGDTLPAPVLTFGSFAAATGLDGEPDLNRLSLTALPGDAGGPVLAASGAVTGLLLPKPAKGRILPKGVAFSAPAAVILPLLQGAGIAATTATESPPLTPQDQATLATAMTVLVSCWD